MAQIYIPSKNLVETLKIDSSELIAIEEFFDAHDDDKWEVVEGKDYKVVNGNGLREYTCSGAFAIAEYLEFKKQSNGWFKKVIRKLILAIKGDIREAFVKQQILSNSSSLVEHDGKFFLSRADVIAIFGTNSRYLTKMLETAKQENKALILNQDYIGDPDKGKHFALSGMEKLAQVFAKNIKCRNRKDWCSDVGKVMTPCTHLSSEANSEERWVHCYCGEAG